MSSLIRPRSPVGSLPFVTSFDEGEGDAYAAGGRLVAAGPWNNLSAQDVLPTWTCALRGHLAATPDYATASNGAAFDGGSSLALTGHGAGEVALYETRIPVARSARPTLAFTSRMLRGARPYVRVTFSDGTSQVVRRTAAGPGWQQTTSPLQARGKTIARISVGFASAGQPVDTLLGQLRLYDAARNARPSAISVTSGGRTISWPRTRNPVISYWNVYQRSGGCLRFLGPAFTTTYSVAQPMFGPRKPAGQFTVQPVSASGSEAAAGPVCAPPG